MKGLLISVAIIFLVTAVGIGASAIVHINLVSSLDTARDTGFDEGYDDGYEEGLIEGSIAGYQEGSKLGYLTSNRVAAATRDGEDFYFIYNPTSEEVREILNEGGLDSAREVIDYSAVNGIRVAYIRCQTVPNEPKGKTYLQELVGFETVDKGFIFIDAELHREVQVEVGVSYSVLNRLPPPSYDDTIGKVTIVW